MSAKQWTIDPAHTQIEFAVKHMMFTTVRGQFSDFQGTVELDRENPAESSVSVAIETASVDTRVSDRHEHPRRKAGRPSRAARARKRAPRTVG